MRPDERVDDLLTAVQSALDGVLPSIWTALPGVVDSVDLAKGTCSVQPAIKAQVTDKTGAKTWVSLPLCPDVPIQFMGGGGFVMTFPFAKGDEGLIVFACRCIDSWWQSGGVQTQAELRLHDLSDGFFVPGFRSQIHKIANINPNFPEWRNAAGTVKMEQVAAGFKVTGTLEVTGVTILDSTLEVNGVTILNETLDVVGITTLESALQLSGNIESAAGSTYTGNITTTGEITKGVGTGDQVTLGGHKHTGNNVAPTPGT